MYKLTNKKLEVLWHYYKVFSDILLITCCDENNAELKIEQK